MKHYKNVRDDFLSTTDYKIDTLPVKGNFITKFFLVHNSIQYIVADVGSCSFHPFNVYFPFSHIKVVLEEWARTWGLPVKFLGNISPKLCNRKGSTNISKFLRLYLSLDILPVYAQGYIITYLTCTLGPTT